MTGRQPHDLVFGQYDVENRRDDTVVDARIEIGLLGDQCDPRAPSAGVRDGHAGRDPGALGHHVGGDHAALDGSRERDDPQGPALQLAVGLFFAGGKEAVEINVQLLRGGRLPHLRTVANIKRIHKPHNMYEESTAPAVLGHVWTPPRC